VRLQLHLAGLVDREREDLPLHPLHVEVLVGRGVQVQLLTDVTVDAQLDRFTDDGLDLPAGWTDR
jgi:hypothetical protein